MSAQSSPSPASPAPSRGLLARFFTQVVAKRWLVVAIYALLLPPSAYFASRVDQDNSITRIIVQSDPDFVATRDFAKVFGAGEYAVLLVEADDPLAPGVVERVDRIERGLRGIPKLEVTSVLGIYRRAKAGFESTPEQLAAFRKFASGTNLFRKQGLMGDHFLSIALVLDVSELKERRATLEAIDRAVDAAGGGSPPLASLRRVGQPYVNIELDESTQRSGVKCFALFMVFVVVLCLALYRSLRTLLAFLLTLGVCLAMSVGYIGITGGKFSIVSPMVPMTILVTTMATLVYLHSRFVDRPADRPVDEHQIFALENKFVACTASIFATAVGFAALAVSPIRPIVEMGIWVGVGLVITWVVVFTLFPALQKILKTPTGQEQKGSGETFTRFTVWLPRASYRFRWPLVLVALGLSALGAVALFGIPGVVASMPLLTDPTEYIDQNSTVYRDMKHAMPMLPGLSVTHVWLKGKLGSVSEPEVLNGLDEFETALGADPDVGAAVGPTNILRIVRYIAGQGDQWPKDADAVNEIAGDLEGLVPQDPTLQHVVQSHSLAQTNIALISRATEPAAFNQLDARVHQHWDEAVAHHPALKVFELKTAGLGRLQAKMSQGLVPTLVESFGLTVAVIFAAFLLVFRSGAARLMALIPSLFAILVMFGVMRVTGMLLNVATILIASTVLGTSENDQIHFFYHFLEKRKTSTVEQSLRHTLQISGRAIFFATLINASGFMAFVFADLPPMRQFGFLSAVALVLSMIADFTALPAALWIIFRAKPDAEAANGNGNEKPLAA